MENIFVGIAFYIRRCQGPNKQNLHSTQHVAADWIRRYSCAATTFHSIFCIKYVLFRPLRRLVNYRPQQNDALFKDGVACQESLAHLHVVSDTTHGHRQGRAFLDLRDALRA